ncbi:unnamed protein product [Effrenium voratum]|uniref:Uncharacterized protein n=1 Tax=Effrenium voratum TaxID=2562239 RepID=A0AA36MR12_9DINO|nr:unnamed protein product [Effrenium voratum]
MASSWLLPVLFLAATGLKKSLPEGPIIAAWQNWGACNETETLQAVERGVNVVFWFATNLIKDPSTQQPLIVGGPNMACMARVRKKIEEKGLASAHLITIGGWNQPHPNTSFSGAEWFQAWHHWNSALPKPFDGFDWDLEGNDNLVSRWNKFSPAVMQVVVDMSAAAKAAGYLVTMAPPTTYFRKLRNHRWLWVKKVPKMACPGKWKRREFNLYLNNTDPDYHPEFFYRGMNSYAYMWAAAPADTFDLVSVQLYENYSPALQALQSGMSCSQYLASFAKDFVDGWVVNFNDTSLPLQGEITIKVPASRLLIGLSFGNPKSAYFPPEAAGEAYEAATSQERPRGYAFWMIAMEGMHANGTNVSVSFASGLNSFLRGQYVKPTPEEPRGYTARRLRTLPHEGEPFTQGLEVVDEDTLIETSGAYPAGTQSLIRLVDVHTGKTKQSSTLEGFAEGVAKVPDGWLVIPYTNHKALKFGTNLELVAEQDFPLTQGWGFARDEKRDRYLATNGTQYVMELNSQLRLESVAPATCLGQTVPGLNELELVEDFADQGPMLFGNLYRTRWVIGLDPETYQCKCFFNLDGFGDQPANERNGFHVANGIAYLKKSRTFIVTGKNWREMFEISLEEQPDSSASQMALAQSLQQLLSESLLQLPTPRRMRRATVQSPQALQVGS